MRSLEFSHQSSAGLKRDPLVKACVTFPHSVDFAVRFELLDAVLPDGFERLITFAIAELQEQRLLYEPGGKIGDSRSRLAVAGADFLYGGEVELAGENAHAPEQAPLFYGEERIAPLHGGAEGALGPVGAPRRLREQGEQIVKMRRDVLRIQAGHARSGKLNRKRESINAAADLAEEAAGALIVERHRRTGASALSEQLY